LIHIERGEAEFTFLRKEEFMTSEANKTGRILIVANRLPVNVKRTGGRLEFAPSAGGLATGLGSLQGSYKTEWIGWPGRVSRDDRKEVESRLISEFCFNPVFLSEQISERYYEGYSNRTLWPIFHSLPTYAKFSAAEWDAYKKANQLFAQKIVELYKDTDIIWIHDYHLMLVPHYVRNQLPKATMGFFLHIPFPHYEIFRLLPQHKEIVDHLLSLDLIGFHTHEYAQAFLGSVRRMLGYDSTLGQIQVDDRVVQVDVFPMGIDFQKFSEATSDESVKSEVIRIHERLKSRKTVFMVSRLDYTKGVPESLEAIEEFFTRFPEWHEKIIVILVIVPSREKVERYASLKREIDELVGRINSKFGTLYWIPIGYIYRALSFAELIALYDAADVAFITPMRDGMNLIAKEFLAVKKDGAGVLVLSEMAGASKELPEAEIVNPNSKEEVAEALNRALLMPEEEMRRRISVMRQRLESHDINHWVQKFFTRLSEVREISRLLSVKLLDVNIRKQLVSDYKNSPRRLVILDYDGTLVPFADVPSKAAPDEAIKSVLQKLSVSNGTHLVILSGRDRNTLQQWLGDLSATLVAEHGGWVRHCSTTEWTPVIHQTENNWKKEILPIMQIFVDRIPGSFVEEKDFSLVWHYRQADSESANNSARELLDTVSNLSANLNIQVLSGNKAIEVRHIGISKGIFFSQSLAKDMPEFILAMGDDLTDEDLFAVLPQTAYSIKVGLKMSKARYNVKSVPDVRSLLEQLVA
jgi:trehalose 6-phosphate synthase/phosphatase